MELWQTAAQELDRLQQVYQKTISDGQIHDAQRQQLKVHFSHVNMQSHHIISPLLAHQPFTTRWSHYHRNRLIRAVWPQLVLDISMR